MKKLLFFLLLTILFVGCGEGERRLSSEYNPEVFFSEEELPIAKAIRWGDEAELKRLIQQDAVDINKLGKEGCTYLYYALMILEYDKVKLLLENGADPNVVSLRTYTPGAGHQSEPTKKPCIETACYSKYDIKYLKLLIEYGADVNEASHVLPLTRAIEGDQRKKINYLLKNGADPNVMPAWGMPPILDAAILRRWELVDLFLDAGADPFIEKNGRTLNGCIQRYINSSEGAPGNREQLQSLMKRLQKEGMQFDFSEAKIKI